MSVLPYLNTLQGLLQHICDVITTTHYTVHVQIYVLSLLELITAFTYI